MDSLVSVVKSGRSAWVAMNNPGALNSLTPSLCAELSEAFAACGADERVRVVILCGEGKAFCAGGDLRTISAMSDKGAALEYVRAADSIIAAVINSEKPFIAMVGGAAAGAGFNLALACDFICASKNARFTQAFSSIGLVPDCGGSFLLPRALGLPAAKRLSMLPETLSAEEAYRLGLLTLVAADGEALRTKTAALAERLAKQPPLALARIKKLLNCGAELEKAMRLEELYQSELIIGEDCKEGIKAFFEKREPQFSGRN